MDDSSIQDATALISEESDTTTTTEKQPSTVKTNKRASKRNTRQKSASSSATSHKTGRDESVEAAPNSSRSKKKKATPQSHEQEKKHTSSATATTANKKTPPPRTSGPAMPTFSRVHQNELKKVVSECFGYHLKEMDLQFVQDLYTDLPVLTDTWDRIGFNADTKKIRLEKFYTDITERFQGLIESEQELEENIREEIEKHRARIKQLCFDLQVRNADDVKNKAAPGSGNANRLIHMAT